MFLTKTDKARHELLPGRRTLGQRERALLLMADGQRSLTDFGALFGGREEAGRVARHLLQEGFLQGRQVEAVEVIEAAPVAADIFDGKPSLATTRMFLFDLCERMFVRRDPVLAERFREALREARDRDSMLVTARAMLGEIEQAAGAPRAEAIRERIEKLLPASPVH
ncbi:hypothetical protein QTI17_09225 [Variovorax sp. J31P179]|uniref:hypothetical protein n=1 Tax=Variovorax sp. J31P179 TaxID=3053508 RepID=UPI002578CE6D|nr:hypothetical protein [Variovorax sp. J31P179]MDM0080771.1 hypothetical protein [Variovorax sp. J31P179]